VPDISSIHGTDSRFNLGEFLPSPVRELERDVNHSSDNDESESGNHAMVQEEVDEFFGSNEVDSSTNRPAAIRTGLRSRIRMITNPLGRLGGAVKSWGRYLELRALFCPPDHAVR
jgi:hypothetical protein